MTKLRFLYLFITILFIIPISYGEEVIFYEFNTPPFQISEGEFKGKGVLNYFKDSFIKEFKDYDIKTYVSYDIKVLSEMKKKPNIIFSAGLKIPERKEIGLYSIPYLLLLPNGIIIDKNDYDKFSPYLNEVGEVKLEYLITESRLKGGVSLERTYGGIIDEILIKHQHNKFIIPEYYESLEKKIQKIENNELDFVFGYPVEAEFFMKNDPQSKKDIITLAVEGMPEYLLVYLLISKGDFGEKMITEINIFLEKIVKQKEYHEKYEYWLDEENKKRYRTYIKQVFNYSY
ncbi:MAG: transporter substrate-binding domain-containing protein [Spirochaetaceae bacterium]